MGAGSLWHWIVVAIVVALIFGTKKLRNVGEDLGAAIKGFKDGMKQEQEIAKLEDNSSSSNANANANAIKSEISEVNSSTDNSNTANKAKS